MNSMTEKPYSNHVMLQENYAPVAKELKIDNLPVTFGKLPEGLEGTLYRNGPNPQFPPLGEDHHWFFSEGMIHAIRLSGGKVSYLNRWVRTSQYKAQEAAGKRLISTASPAPAGDLNPHFANTNTVILGGKLYALEEFNLPMMLDPQSLETIGTWDAEGKYVGPFTAHPKYDPKTGHLLAFGYQAGGFGTATVQYNELDTNGKLIRNERFEAPFASVMHDFVATDDHLVFPVFPATISIERAMRGGSALAWEPNKGTHIGIVARNQDMSKMRWFKGPPCYSYHIMNAQTVTKDDATVVMVDLMKFSAIPLFPDNEGNNFTPWLSDTVKGGELVRWTFNLDAEDDTYTEEILSKYLGEFPRVDERYNGAPYEHGYYISQQGAYEHGSFFDTLVHVNVKTKETEVYTPSPRAYFHEPVFVPRSPDSKEGDGWIVTVMYNREKGVSEFVVFNALNVSSGPVAKVELPSRVPYGFHGGWFSND